MILDQDFKDFIKLLNKNKVRYLVVGGHAVALHGHPRYTKDLDIWIESENTNVDNLISTLKDFGFSALDIKTEDFLVAGNIVQLGYPPNRIGLLTSIDGVNFDACYESRIEIQIEEAHVNFIDLENLIKNKKASGRYQDLADLENLK